MSSVAGIVCEGQTDAPILRALLQAVWPDLEVRMLQPELDETDRAKGPAGWSEVRAWCERNAAELDEVLNPDVGDPIDLLLIAVDVDIAVQAGIEDPPREVGAYETTRLRETIRGWLRADGRRALPTALVLSTPTMAIEAWIIAGLYPKEHHPEQIQNPDEWLVGGRVLRRSPKDNRPWKEGSTCIEALPPGSLRTSIASGRGVATPIARFARLNSGDRRSGGPECDESALGGRRRSASPRRERRDTTTR